MNRLFVPDRDGKLADVICGFDSIADYVTDRLSYTGAIIGRYGNRIGGGGFTIGDTFYAVASNEKGRGHLHGGNVGFNRRLWDAEPIEGEGADSLVMSLFSPDGEEGYPGDLYVKVTYTFDDDNALTIRYEATSSKDTVLNMTSHTYYNLNGYDGSSVMDQELRIAADRYDVIDELFIPVGDPASVEGTVTAVVSSAAGSVVDSSGWLPLGSAVSSVAREVSGSAGGVLTGSVECSVSGSARVSLADSVKDSLSGSVGSSVSGSVTT
jgi:aldose 1-epimerase